MYTIILFKMKVPSQQKRMYEYQKCDKNWTLCLKVINHHLYTIVTSHSIPNNYTLSIEQQYLNIKACDYIF